MTISTYQVNATKRVRVLAGNDGGVLMLHEELRQIGTGTAWCIVGCELCLEGGEP